MIVRDAQEWNASPSSSTARTGHRTIACGAVASKALTRDSPFAGLPSGMIRLSSAICKAPRGRTGPWGGVEPRSDARAPPLDSFPREFRSGL